jgi:hypothetical protein
MSYERRRLQEQLRVEMQRQERPVSGWQRPRRSPSGTNNLRPENVEFVNDIRVRGYTWDQIKRVLIVLGWTETWADELIDHVRENEE